MKGILSTLSMLCFWGIAYPALGQNNLKYLQFLNPRTALNSLTPGDTLHLDKGVSVVVMRGEQGLRLLEQYRLSRFLGERLILKTDKEGSQEKALGILEKHEAKLDSISKILRKEGSGATSEIGITVLSVISLILIGTIFRLMMKKEKLIEHLLLNREKAGKTDSLEEQITYLRKELRLERHYRNSFGQHKSPATPEEKKTPPKSDPSDFWG